MGFEELSGELFAEVDGGDDALGIIGGGAPFFIFITSTSRPAIRS